MLPPMKEELMRRRWIWQALSDLFLDDEIDEDTLRYTSRIAAECEYSNEELDAIYRKEVAPALAFNFYRVAGTNWYWDTVWLEQQILAPHRLGYWFDRLIVAPLPVWLLRHEYMRIKSMLPEQRERVREAKKSPHSEWKPCWSEDPPVYRWESAEQSNAPK